MEKVWAQTPYVTYVGPRSTAIIVGWELKRNTGPNSTSRFRNERSRWLMLMYVLLVNLAWEIGIESRLTQMKDGSARKVDWVMTQRLRENRRPLANGLPSCAAEAAMSINDCREAYVQEKSDEDGCSKNRQAAARLEFETTPLFSGSLRCICTCGERAAPSTRRPMAQYCGALRSELKTEKASAGRQGVFCEKFHMPPGSESFPTCVSLSGGSPEPARRPGGS